MMQFPQRRSLDLLTTLRLFFYLCSSIIKGQDPGYAGLPYLKYCSNLCDHFSVKYSIPCCSGTNATYLAIKALNLPSNSVIHVSSISDPGTYSAVIENSFDISLIDSQPLSGRSSIESLRNQLTPRSSAVVLVHHAGYPSDVSAFQELCSENNIFLIQDFSQFHTSSQHSAQYTSYGVFSILSTMYRKSHSTGGSGGVLLSNSPEHAMRARSLADRGKYVDSLTSYVLDNRDGNLISQPSINHTLDDISCLLGTCSLAKLNSVISSRLAFTQPILDFVSKCSPFLIPSSTSHIASPFIIPITVNPCYSPDLKASIDRALLNANVPHNPNYQYLSSSWDWLQPYLLHHNTPNAATYLSNTTFLYVNERYQPKHAKYIIEIIRESLNTFQFG